MTSVNIPVYQNGRWELKKKKQQLIKKSLEDSFEYLQDLILEAGTKGLFNCSLSGSTLTVLLVSDDETVFVANVGDSKALMIQVDRKSKEHALANPDPE
jgi:serine/threonine protein phosphatase PrpC